MLDLEEEFRKMAIMYNIPEKDIATWWRGAVRSMWGDSPFKRKYEEDTVERIPNTNPRTMKRYPVVKRFTCSDCGESFGTADSQLDHLEGRNQMKTLADAESFFKAILLTPPEGVQWLCADKKKVVSKKKYVYAVGCHSIKSLMEANPSMSREEAQAKKEFTRIKKYDGVDKGLQARGVVLPKLKKDQETLLLKLLMEEFNAAALD